jgi:hypothetical protein
MIWAQWAGCDTGGEPTRARDLVAEAERLVGSRDDPLLQGGVASMRGFSARHFGRMREAFDDIDRAVTLFAQAEPTQEAGLYLNGVITSLGFRHWARAMTQELDEDAIDRDYRTQDLPFGRMVMAMFGAASCLVAGQGDLDTWVDRMRDADPDMTLSFWSASTELYSALALLHHGEVDGGLAVLAAGREHMRQAGGRAMVAGVLATAAQALAGRERLDEAQLLLADARTELVEAGEQAYLPVLELAEAHAAFHRGDVAGARRAFRAAARTASAHGSHGLVARVQREQADLFALAAAGRGAEPG